MKNNLQSIQSIGFVSLEMQFPQDGSHHTSCCEEQSVSIINNNDIGDHAISVSSSEPHQAQR